MHTPIDQGQLECVREFIALVSQQVKKCADTQIKKCAESSDDPCKITNQELTLLFLLSERGSLAVKEIASHLEGVSLSTLTRMLDKLEEHGYVTRTLDRKDRRSFLIGPTDRAHEVVASYKQQMQSLAYVILEALTPSERWTFIELYMKIRANLYKRSPESTEAPEARNAPSHPSSN